MSVTHHRTWQKYHVGRLNITVQLDSAAEERKFERHQELASVVRQLISTMDASQIPATWAVSDPAHSAATSMLLKSDVDHELAILADANWVGPTAGRTRFAHELVRRVTQARASGIQVSSLVTSVASIETHIDLVVKQQITAVAGLATTSGSRSVAEPRALHYGVWELPVATKLPMESGWFSSAKRSAWRSIQRAAADASESHLMIDAAAIASAGRGEEAIVVWLMDHVATLRDRGIVRVETMRTTAARLSDVPAVAPQRSILRVA